MGPEDSTTPTDNTPSEGETHDEFVPLPDADDADIDAFLNKARSDLETPITPEEAEAPETEEEGELAADTEEDEEAPPPEEKPKKRKEKKENVSTLKETNPQEYAERLERQLAQQETFIQRRNQELGDMRKAHREAVKALEAKLADKMQDDPVAAAKDIQEISENTRREELLGREQSQLNHIHESHKIVSAHVKPEDGVTLDDMVHALEIDGVDPGYVHQFKANPYLAMEAGAIIQLAKRVRAEKYVAGLIPYAQELQKKVAELEKKPSQVLNKVGKALNETPRLNGSSGGSSPSIRSNANIAPTSMTYAEIEEYLKRA